MEYNTAIIYLLDAYSTLFSGLCTATIPSDIYNYIDPDQCTQQYNMLRGSDQTDYGPYWTSWPPIDGSTPLEGVTDDNVVAYYDAFKYKHKGEMNNIVYYT